MGTWAAQSKLARPDAGFVSASNGQGLPQRSAAIASKRLLQAPSTPAADGDRDTTKVSLTPAELIRFGQCVANPRQIGMPCSPGPQTRRWVIGNCFLLNFRTIKTEDRST